MSTLAEKEAAGFLGGGNYFSGAGRYSVFWFKTATGSFNFRRWFWRRDARVCVFFVSAAWALGTLFYIKDYLPVLYFPRF